LTVLKSKNKPSTKHEKDEYDKISTKIRGLSDRIPQFCRIYISIGVYQEKRRRYNERQAKKHILQRNQV
jgi:hypothetical protein